MIVLSCLVLSCLVLSCLVLPCLVLSCLVLSCLVLSCLVLSCHVLSCLQWLETYDYDPAYKGGNKYTLADGSEATEPDAEPGAPEEQSPTSAPEPLAGDTVAIEPEQPTEEGESADLDEEIS